MNNRETDLAGMNFLKVSRAKEVSHNFNCAQFHQKKSFAPPYLSHLPTCQVFCAVSRKNEAIMSEMEAHV